MGHCCLTTSTAHLHASLSDNQIPSTSVNLACTGPIPIHFAFSTCNQRQSNPTRHPTLQCPFCPSLSGLACDTDQTALQQCILIARVLQTLESQPGLQTRIHHLHPHKNIPLQTSISELTLTSDSAEFLQRGRKSHGNLKALEADVTWSMSGPDCAMCYAGS